MLTRTPIPWLVGINLACLGLGGCNVGPTYQEPIVVGSLDRWGGEPHHERGRGRVLVAALP